MLILGGIKIEGIVKKVELLIIILVISFFSYMYSSYEHYNQLNRYSLYLVLFMNVLITILEFKNILQYKKKQLIIVLIIIANVFFTSIINNNGFGAIGVIINLLCLILLFDVFRIEKKHLRLICLIIAVGDILFLMSNKINYNTNTCGYLAFAMLPFSLVYFLSNSMDKVIRRMIGIIGAVTVIVFTFFTIQGSDSRGALLGFLLFILVVCTSNKILKNKRIYNTLIFILMLSILCFVFLYVNLWNNGVEFAIPFTDKSLYSGREAIWTELLKVFNSGDNYLYGLGSKYNIQSFEVMNVHNSALYILIMYGGINFILFYALFYTTLNKTNKYIDNNINKIFMATIIGMLIVSFFETNLEWTDVNIYFILAVLFCCSTDKEDREEIIKSEK